MGTASEVGDGSERVNLQQAAIRYAVDRPQVVEELIADELVIVSFRTGRYHGVRGSGVIIWQLLEAGHSVAEIVAQVSQRFTGLDGENEQQIAHFVDALEEQALIVRAIREPEATNTAHFSEEKPPFSKPELESRADLQDHLLLDPIHDVDEYGWPNPKH